LIKSSGPVSKGALRAKKNFQVMKKWWNWQKNSLQAPIKFYYISLDYKNILDVVEKNNVIKS